MTSQPNIKVGHQAAADWYADLNRRVAMDPSYLVPSNLAITVAALPPRDADDFLESLGAMIVGWLSYGQPTAGVIFGAEKIRVQSMKHGEQDAYFDALETSDE